MDSCRNTFARVFLQQLAGAGGVVAEEKSIHPRLNGTLVSVKLELLVLGKYYLFSL